jgi:C-terminal processing protease CtpA/Prc
VDNNTAGEKLETIHATLMRDPMGLGFSIAGGKGAEPYIEGSESVFISKIAEGGPASRDGKIHVGDRLIQVPA